MAVVQGIDVSAFQTVDYARAATKIDFLIAKATEGAHTTSSAWRTHWSGARGAKLLRGSYHLCHPSSSSATDEAKNYVAALKSAGFISGRDLPPVLDIEPAHGLSRSGLTSWARAFFAYVDNAFGLTSPWLRCGVYIGDSVPNVDKATITSGRWFWRGTYPSVVDNGTVIPSGCSIAQWVTPVSQVPGVSGNGLDRDVARPEDLRRMAPAYYSDQPQPLPPPPTEDEMELTDSMTVPAWFGETWPTDTGLADGHMIVQTALVSGYGHARLAQERTAAIVAQLGALKGSLDAVTAALAALSAGGQVIDVQELVDGVRQAAEDGAEAALERLKVVVDPAGT